MLDQGDSSVGTVPAEQPQGLSFNPRTHRKARCGGLCL